MTKIPEDDQELVAFLRQNRPFPPPAKTDVEEQLMQIIENQSQSRLNKSRKHLLWLIPGSLAAVIMFTWGGYRYFKPASLMVKQPVDSSEIEAFLISSWNGTLNETALLSNSETDWLFLETDIADTTTNP